MGLNMGEENSGTITGNGDGYEADASRDRMAGRRKVKQKIVEEQQGGFIYEQEV